MNCNCNVPAITKTSQKTGPNYGRLFFTCGNSSNNSQHCTFFSWHDPSMPISTFAQSKSYNNNNNYNNSNNSNNNTYNNNNNSSSNSNKLSLSLKLTEFEDNNPPKIWFSASHAYSKDLDTYYNTLPIDMKRYDHNKKLWLFDMTIYDRFINELSSSRYNNKIHINDIPKFLANGLKKYISKLSKPVDMKLNIEASLYDTLLPFQIEGVNFVVKRHGRALIGDEMGVGKTIQAIALLQHYRKHWPALILLPPNLMQQWYDEIMNFSGDILQPKDICIVRKATDKVSGKICLVPYSIIDKLSVKESLTHSQFGIVIADESHNLKSKDAQRTTVCLPYLKNATIAVCLSGTPALNRPVELYTQLNGLLPEVFNDYDAFTKRYCDAKPSHFGKNVIDVKGSSNEHELKLILEGVVMIRRLKDVVLKDQLPSKQRDLRYCDIDQAFDYEIKDLQKRTKDIDKIINDPSNDHDRRQAAMNDKQILMNQYYGLTGRAKLKGIIKELEILINERRDWVDNEGESAHDVHDVVTHDKDDNNEKVAYDELKIIDDDVDNHPYKEINVIDLSDLTDDGNYGKMDEDVVDLTNKKEDETNKRDSDTHKPTTTARKSKKSKGTICKDPEAKLMKLEQDQVHFDSFSSNKEENKIEKCFPNTDDLGKNDSDDLVDSDEDTGTQKRVGKRLVRTKDLILSAKDNNATRKSSRSKGDDDDLGCLGSPFMKKNTKSKKNNINHKNTYWGEDDDDDDDDDLFFKSKYSKVAKKEVKKKRKMVTMEDMYDMDDKDSDDDFIDDDKQNNKETWKKLLPGDSKKQKKQKHDDSSPPKYKGLGKKILMFAHHQDVLDGIEDYLREARVGYIRIDGKTEMKSRSVAVKKFQEDDKTEVALLSITACGTGLNLTRASVAFFGELHWTPGVMLQAESRIHRLGQKSNICRILYLLARNTNDKSMWDVINNKIDVLDSTVGMADNTGYGMTINTKKGDFHDSTQTTLNFTRGIQPTQNLTQDKTIQPFITEIDIAPPSDVNNHNKNTKELPLVDLTSPYAPIKSASDIQNQKSIIPAVNIYNNNSNGIKQSNLDMKPLHEKSVYSLLSNGTKLASTQELKHTDENLDSNFFYDVASQMSNSKASTENNKPQIDSNPGINSVTINNAPPVKSASTLSPGQKAMIEEKRRMALEKKAQREKLLKSNDNVTQQPVSTNQRPVSNNQHAPISNQQAMKQETAFSFKTAGNSNLVISNAQLGNVDKFFDTSTIQQSNTNTSTSAVKPKKSID